jgi:chloramphenicol O-acetyltransferase type A
MKPMRIGAQGHEKPAVPDSQGRVLDLDAWPRRQTYEYFRDFDKPWFDICTRVDLAALHKALAARCSLVVACHWLALAMAQRVEAFRYRIEPGGVRVHEVAHGSTTVLREDGAIGFARLPFAERLTDFAATAARSIADARRPQPLVPFDDDDALLHFTTLPWIHFTSFSHARRRGSGDSVPKFAFGRFERDGGRLWMPLSIEVHHGLMDGLHVGQFVQGLEALLADPEPWLADE